LSIGGVSLELTASLGIGLFQPPAGDAITVVSRAKAACVGADQTGGDHTATYVPALPVATGLARSSRLEELIREALRGDGLQLLYQAVVPVQQAPGERYEALLRLRTPSGELIPPLEFLPVAVKCGLMPDIDRWVLTRVMDDIVAARKERKGLVMMARQTLATAAAAEWGVWFHREIVRRNLARQRPVLIFDLEDVADRRDLAKVCFKALEHLGIETCLNHFDGSPSATEVLRQFPWSLVRLSRETVRRMDAAALAAMVEDVHGVGAQAIGVEIEDPQAVARVWGCGVDYIQGNFVQAASELLDFDFVGTELS
jgi:EAL domain-containing protein (putative c-di-GMP-specific phosphodiesterase class I)